MSKPRTRKPSPIARGATPGFPIVKDTLAARLAFAQLAEAAGQKDIVMNEVDDALRAAMLSEILKDLTSATAALMPLLASATSRAQRDARMVGREEAEREMLSAGLDRTTDDREANG